MPRRRLPVGSGAFRDPRILTLTSAPEGGWCWFQDPRAIANGAYTYVGYNAGGDMKIAVVYLRAVVNTVTLHAALEYDDHDTLTMYVRPDGKLETFYSKHTGAVLYSRISTSTLAADPTLANGFAAEVDHAASVVSNGTVSYPSPVYIASVDGGAADTFLFWREIVTGDGQWWYSSDQGGTWAGHAVLHTLDYSRVIGNGATRVDVAVSDHPADGANKVYHVYRESAAWHQSDGTALGALPYTGADLTLVWDGSGASDLAWVSDLAIDGSGNPIIVFARYPAGSTADIRYMYARWTGAVWDVHEICAAGGYISETAIPAGQIEVYYHAGLSLDRADPQIVYCGRKVGSQFEAWKYVTADGGATFTGAPLTASSGSAKQIRPVGVHGQGDIAAVWLSGTFNNYMDYSLALKAYRP